MGFNWTGIIVRADIEAVRNETARPFALPGGFVRVSSDVDWTQPGSTVKWSTKFGEAWLFVAASTSDVFAYEHSRDGKILRALGFDGSEGWHVAHGEPEDWEKFDGEPTVGELEPFADSDLVIAIAKSLGTELVRG